MADTIIRIKRLQWDSKLHTENPFFQFQVSEGVLTVTYPKTNETVVKNYGTEDAAKKVAEEIHNNSMLAFFKQEEYTLEMP